MLKRWVLKLAGVSTTKYLADYRTGRAPWTHDLGRAESFTRAIDAVEMARRVSHLLGMDVEAMSIGDDGRDDVDTCVTLGCGVEVEYGRMHCPKHAMPLMWRPAVDLIDPDLTPQEVEAAWYQAVHARGK